MDFLDSLVLPVQGAFLNLLNFMLMLMKLMFTVYTGILFGTAFLSYWNFRKGAEANNGFNRRFSSDIISIMTSSPSSWFGFGMMPLLAIIFMYIQLVEGTGSKAPQILFVAFLVYVIALAVAYFYRYSMHFTDLFGALKGQRKLVEDWRSDLAGEYNDNMVNLTKTSSFWSVSLLFVAMWIYEAGIYVASNPSSWGTSAMENLFAYTVMLKTLTFAVAGIALGGASFVFIRFWWDGGYNYRENDKDYAEKSRNVAAGTALTGLILQPLFFGLSFVFIDAKAVSAWSFVFAAFSVVLAFVASHQIYSIVRLKNVSFIKFGYWFLILGFFGFVLSEQFGFQSSNSQNVARRTHEFEMIELAKKAAAAGPAPVDYVKIYENKCMNCHNFDESNKQAPAYAEVLPKYVEGDRFNVDDLIEFIANPNDNRKNPKDYPGGMGNQVKNKREAEVMAKYLLTLLSEQKGIGEPYNMEEIAGGGEAAAGDSHGGGH